MSHKCFRHVFHSIIFYITIFYHILPTHSIQNDGGIILKGGNNYGNDPYNGRVEICHNSQWGTICDDLYTSFSGSGNSQQTMNNVCKVICTQLGYTTCDDTSGLIDNGAKPYASAGSGTIWLDDTVCDGTESKISDCQHDPWGSNNCGHSEDITIQCSGYIGGGYISTECTPSLSSTPTPSPTPSPTSSPSPSPTSSPTSSPTPTPTNNPTDSPIPAPTNNPTTSPTPAPTHIPTNNPTNSPTPTPTTNPSNSPTTTTDFPTETPTFSPTDNPTDNSLIVQKTAAPTAAPIGNEGSQHETPVTTNIDQSVKLNNVVKNDVGKLILEGLIYIITGAVACCCILCFVLIIYRAVKRRKHKSIGVTKGGFTAASPVSSISSIAMTSMIHGTNSRENNGMKLQKVMSVSHISQNTMPNLFAGASMNMSASNIMHMMSNSMNYNVDLLTLNTSNSINICMMQDDENAIIGPGSPYFEGTIGTEDDVMITPGTLKLNHAIASHTGTDGTGTDVDDDILDNIDINDETVGNITAGNIVINEDKDATILNESYRNENGDILIGSFDINKVALDEIVVDEQETLGDEITTMGNEEDVTMDNDVNEMDK